jgi:hypothetical protein
MKQNNNNDRRRVPAKQGSVLRRALTHFVAAFGDKDEARKAALEMVEQICSSLSENSPEKDTVKRVLMVLFPLAVSNKPVSSALDAMIKAAGSEDDLIAAADWYFDRSEEGGVREGQIRTMFFDTARELFPGQKNDLRTVRTFCDSAFQEVPEFDD